MFEVIFISFIIFSYSYTARFTTICSYRLKEVILQRYIVFVHNEPITDVFIPRLIALVLFYSSVVVSSSA